MSGLDILTRFGDRRYLQHLAYRSSDYRSYITYGDLMALRAYDGDLESSMIASSSSVSRRGSPFATSDSIDPWSSSSLDLPAQSTSTVRRRPHTRQNSGLDDDNHPLDLGSGSKTPEDDVSRPTLRRLTSETERHVAESSRSGASESGTGSVRGSFDILRMSSVEESAKEVEVLVHHVLPTESLQGIALLYGIDVATLRKANKLWASDPVHLRTHLYVPLEACRWNKASETFTRGPESGQITLTPRTASKDKGKGKARKAVLAHGEDVWDHDNSARTFMPSTNMVYDRASIETTRSTIVSLDSDEEEITPRILDVVRIPNSQLRFFPRPQKPPDPTRNSFDDSPRRRPPTARKTSEHGPSIQNDLHTLPRPLLPNDPAPPKPKPNTVRLRPPQNPVPTAYSSKIANRLSSFFDVPPPPPHLQPFGTVPAPIRSRPSIESAGLSRRSSTVSTPGGVKQTEVLLELKPRSSREILRGGSDGHGKVSVNGKGNHQL